MGDRNGSKKAGAKMINKTQNQNNNYKMFKDEARGTSGRDGFLYTGDGQEQEDWFKQHSNYDDLISNMTNDERSAFLRWAEGYFMDGEMYKGWERMGSSSKEYTQIYDKILDRATLDHGVIVARDSTAELIFGKGHKTTTLEELKAAQGQVVTTASALSSGAASTGLSIGDSSKQILYRISIPAGAKGAGMWIADSRIHGWGRRQLEFMINRDSTFKVGKTVWDDRLKKYVVSLKWLGHSKHEYGKSRKARNWA